MPEPTREPSAIVSVLRVIGVIEIFVSVLYLVVEFLEAFGGTQSAVTGPLALGLAGLVSGVLFLAIAFIADKLDSIDQSLAVKPRAGRSVDDKADLA